LRSSECEFRIWKTAREGEGGKGKIISNCGLRIANLKTRSQEPGDSSQKGKARDMVTFDGKLCLCPSA
jgi:hypothetical protein